MQNLIKYVCEILNIKTESTFALQDIAEELQKVKDIVAYKNYIKENISEIEYKTGFQVFMILTKRYLEIEALGEFGKEAQVFSLAIIKKVKACADFVESNYIEFKAIKVEDDKYFEWNEIKALESIGNSTKVIELMRERKLDLELKRYFIDIKKQIRITNEL